MLRFALADMANCMGGWYIPNELSTALVKDFKNRQKNWQQAHSSRGYHLLPHTDMSPYLVSVYERCLAQIAQQYTNYFPYSKEGMAGWTLAPRYNFQYYPPGKSYSTWHCENNGEPQFLRRHLAFMTYLNTVEDGGETHFIHQDKKFKPKIGLTLVWPAYFTHTHRGIPAKTEEKYVTTGWFEFFDTENFMETQRNMSDEEFYQKTDEVLSKVT